MKTMLESEFRRFTSTVWIIRRVLVLMPLLLITYGTYELDQDILLIASLVFLQNAVVLWVIAQWS